MRIWPGAETRKFDVPRFALQHQKICFGTLASCKFKSQPVYRTVTLQPPPYQAGQPRANGLTTRQTIQLKNTTQPKKHPGTERQKSQLSLTSPVKLFFPAMATNGISGEAGFAPLLEALSTLQRQAAPPQKEEAHRYLETFQKSVSCYRSFLLARRRGHTTDVFSSLDRPKLGRSPLPSYSPKKLLRKRSSSRPRPLRAR